MSEYPLRDGMRRLFRLDAKRVERASAESNDELASFLEARAEDLIAHGMSEEEARREAVLRLGSSGLEGARAALNRSAAQRESRLSARELVDDIRSDFRVAVRALWRERGYALVVSATLALGIGTSAATFAAIEHVLLRPLPVREQRTLALLRVENDATLDKHVGITYGLLAELQARSHVVKSIAGVPAALSAAPYAARDGNRVVQLALTGTTGNFFEVLGVAPQQGRMLDASDDVGTRGAAAVVSYSAWQSQFGGMPNIVGHQIAFNVGTFTIVGVAPREFAYPRGTDIWVSDAEFLRLAGYLVKDGDGYWDALVRMRSANELEEASNELMATVKESTSPLLGPIGKRRVVARTFTDIVVGNQRDALFLFAAAVVLVLIVSCTNVAGLLLARGITRAREVAVRRALGATAQRMVRQLMVENLVLGVIGGLLGIACAKLVLTAIVMLAPVEFARMNQVQLDPVVIAFAVAVTILAVAAFGLAPSFVTARATLDAPLRSDGRSQSASVRVVRTRRWLVAFQVALGVVMLTSAALLLRNLSRLQKLQLGFNPTHLLFVFVEQLDASGADMNAGEVRHTAVIEKLVDRLKAMPGVVNATPVDAIPFAVVAGTGGLDVHYNLDGQPYSAGMSSPKAGFNIASKDYFATLGIPLVHGRVFTMNDRTGNPQVAIVSEAFAKRAWPGRESIGQQLRFLNDGAVGLWRVVVGVVADTRYHDFLTERPEVYIPLYQSGPGTFIAVRTAGEPMKIEPLVRDALRGLDQGYGMAKTISSDQLLGARLARPKFVAATVVVLAGTVAILAAIGLFGVLSFTINQRRHEFGIRLALGATKAHLRSLVYRDVVRLSLIGLTIGLAIGLPVARILRHEIVGVSVYDPVSLFGVLAVLFVSVGAASALPVIRAARVDPASAIRE